MSQSSENRTSFELENARRVRALLIEDNPGDIQLIQEMIQEDTGRPVDLHPCGDLASAKERLSRESFDVVLCDLGLPDSNGIEILSNLLAVAGHTPVLALTEHDDAAQSRRCLTEGAYDYVCKSHIGADFNAIIHNAQERYRLRSELADAHESMRNLLSDSDDGMLILDRGNRVRFANRAANAMFEGKLEVGAEFGATVTGDSRTVIDVVTRDRGTRNVEVRARPTRWLEEQATVVNLRDITERVSAQQRIEHLNRVLKAIRNVDQLIVMEREPAALIEKACALLTETRGYNGAWIVLGDGKGAVNGFAQAGWDRDFDPLAARLECGEWPACASRALAEDESYVVQAPRHACTGCPMSGRHGDNCAVTALRHDSIVYGVLGVSFPVSMMVNRDERDLLFEAARDIAFALHNIGLEREKSESESRLTAAVQGGDVGLWDWDLVTQQMNFSKEWKAHIGYGPDEIADTYDAWERRVHPDDLPAVLAQLERSLASSKHPFEVEFRFRHKDGTYRWILARAVVARGHDNTPARMYGSHIDVTELRRQREQHERAQQVAHVGHWELDSPTGSPTWSDEIYRIFGLSPQKAPPSLTAHDTNVHPENYPQLAEAIRAGFEAGRSFDLLFRIVKLDGDIGWIHAIGEPQLDETGKVVRMFGTAQDVTAQKRTEKYLAESERRFRNITENMFDMVVLADMEGRCTFASASHRQLGHDPGDLVGKPIHALVHEADLAGVLRKFAEGVQTREAVRATFRMRRGDGSYAWVESIGKVLIDDDGQPRGMITSTHDITDLKNYERQLRTEKNRAQQYLDVAAVMLLGLDGDGRITLINQRGCEALGVSGPEALLGRDWFQFIPEDRRDEVRAFHRQNMAGDVASQRRVENKIRTVAGEERTVVWHNAVIRDTDGTVIGTLSSGEDVTERKQMEAQLAQADRLSSMGMLAAGVAHEINNPLSYILYNLESLGEDLPQLINALRRFLRRLSDKLSADDIDAITGDDAEKLNPIVLDDIQSRLKDALGGTYRIRDVSRGLGTFSRVEKDQLVPINLMHVIEVALNMAFNEIKYRARLVKDYGRNLPLVLGSEGRLGQVFLNLVINATHAIKEGDFENNEIRIKTWAEGDFVFAQVKDTGSGIPPENLGKLFEPFFTTKQIGVGSGLGLAISKDIVEGYGGSIEVESEVGKGTCFTIRLPVQKQETDPTAGDSAEAALKTARGRILIVDDEEGIRAAMVRMLRTHETVQAATGAEAKQVLEQDQRFDLILCDMMMPDVSGMDLHMWLTAAHPVLARQLIFVTGGAFTPKAREYLSQVDNVRLEKPFDVSSFRRIVHDTIVAGRRSG